MRKRVIEPLHRVAKQAFLPRCQATILSVETRSGLVFQLVFPVEMREQGVNIIEGLYPSGGDLLVHVALARLPLRCPEPGLGWIRPFRSNRADRHFWVPVYRLAQAVYLSD